MQTYYMIPGVVEMIMTFKIHEDYAEHNFEGTAKASLATVE